MQMQKLSKETKSAQISLLLRGTQIAHQRSMQKNRSFLRATSLLSTNFSLQNCLKPHMQLSTISFTSSTEVTAQTPQN